MVCLDIRGPPHTRRISRRANGAPASARAASSSLVMLCVKRLTCLLSFQRSARALVSSRRLCFQQSSFSCASTFLRITRVAQPTPAYKHATSPNPHVSRWLATASTGTRASQPLAACGHATSRHSHAPSCACFSSGRCTSNVRPQPCAAHVHATKRWSQLRWWSSKSRRMTMAVQPL